MATLDERRDACPAIVRFGLLVAIFVIPLFGPSRAVRGRLIDAYGAVFPYSFAISYLAVVVVLGLVVLAIMLTVGQLVLNSRAAENELNR